jgi:hypothetical protein
MSFLAGCGSKDTEEVPPGVNLPPPQDREKGPKSAFSLKVQPEVVRLAQGGKAKVLISAQRQGYDGPIVIELSNLPAKVSPSAAKAAIAAGAKQVEIEILAAQDAEVGEKTNASVMASSNLPLVTPRRFEDENREP